MEPKLSEPLKAILLKIALELKKMGWKSDSQSSEIDVFQGHLRMFKEWNWSGQGDIPDVNVIQSVDMTLARNEQNAVYFLIYKANYQLFIDGVGGNDSEEESDTPVDFTDKDVNGIDKIQSAAKQINQSVGGSAEEKAYEFSNESSTEWKSYNSNSAATHNREDPWEDGTN